MTKFVRFFDVVLYFLVGVSFLFLAWHHKENHHEFTLYMVLGFFFVINAAIARVNNELIDLRKRVTELELRKRLTELEK